MLRNLHRLLGRTPPVWKSAIRCAAAGNAPSTVKAVKYTDTINLPKTKFPQRLTAAKRAETERRINEVGAMAPQTVHRFH